VRAYPAANVATPTRAGLHVSADRYVVRRKNVDIVGATHHATVGGGRHRLSHVPAELEQRPRTSPECATMLRPNSRRYGDAVCRCPDTDGWRSSRNCRSTHGGELIFFGYKVPMS